MRALPAGRKAGILSCFASWGVLAAPMFFTLSGFCQSYAKMVGSKLHQLDIGQSCCAMAQRSRSRLLRGLPVLVGVGGATWAADELYWHRVLQRSARTVKAGIYLLWQYKVCWTPETSDLVHGRVAKRLVDCLRRNEGLYVKFGQAMSTMDIVLPQEYKNELRTLHDQAATFDFPEARCIPDSVPIWMSRRPSPEASDNDEISLAVAFQGLKISVVGPATQALDFVNKLVPGHQHSSAGSASSSAPPASSSTPPGIPPCPDSVLALASRLSAVSILSPTERVLRAWAIGHIARAQLDSSPLPDYTIVSSDLPNKYHVVLRGRGLEEPRVYKNQVDFRKALQGLSPPLGVGHEFPSETEARAYLTAAGWGHFSGC
eukprot:s643_g14.t1